MRSRRPGRDATSFRAHRKSHAAVLENERWFGDGLPDLVVADYGSNAVSVLLNTTAPGATTARIGRPVLTYSKVLLEME